MSWLWGKKDDGGTSEIHNDEDNGKDAAIPNNERDDDDVDDDDVSDEYDDISDNEESSDDSSIDDSSDDDDSLVMNLVESNSTDDDISIIEKPDDFETDSDSDSDDEDGAVSSQASNHVEKENPEDEILNKGNADISTIKSKDTSRKEQHPNNINSENDDPVTSFWEKQSLLVLAAEHDRVDILKALLKDENEEKETLLNSGIPPLHLAISFGSVNTAQSLLRMGADPSVRPDIKVVLEQRKNQPEDSKVDIPNIHKFDMITAWELAFGNALYEERGTSKRSSGSWSLFGPNASAEIDGEKSMTTLTNKIVKPVDMAPSKREGIRHAFTAEALRSIGSDEVNRLKQLVNSGMPSSIDIGGKDLYGWAIEMGALECEEFLRPVEAAKYNENADQNGENVVDSLDETSAKETDLDKKQSSFVVHRPDAEETIPQLKNRLDELNSLSTALSICLDNLAEEVSVCHGLLLMGGGASALASHVKSLKDLKMQKSIELEDAQLECMDAERELADLVHSSGDVGKEIAGIASTKFLTRGYDLRIGQGETEENIGDDGNSQLKQSVDTEQLNLKAEIAASENKIRKLRASIADLSEENTRDLAEVNRRGLEGGINLVRGLREELRDLEYHLSEVRSMKTACKAKISMILSRISRKENGTKNTADDLDAIDQSKKFENGNRDPSRNASAGFSNENESKRSINTSLDVDEKNTDAMDVVKPSETLSVPNEELLKENESQSKTNLQSSLSGNKGVERNVSTVNKVGKNMISASTKIANGDSQAIAIIQPGSRGFFTVDLWEVLLRIIGYERAANRRSVQNATNTTSSSRQHVMII